MPATTSSATQAVLAAASTATEAVPAAASTATDAVPAAASSVMQDVPAAAAIPNPLQLDTSAPAPAPMANPWLNTSPFADISNTSVPGYDPALVQDYDPSLTMELDEETMQLLREGIDLMNMENLYNDPTRLTNAVNPYNDPRRIALPPQNGSPGAAAASPLAASATAITGSSGRKRGRDGDGEGSGEPEKKRKKRSDAGKRRGENEPATQTTGAGEKKARKRRSDAGTVRGPRQRPISPRPAYNVRRTRASTTLPLLLGAGPLSTCTHYVFL
ncbi:hypothetical protein B0H12DRAFT_1078937 [Mycena haematopus]|nr:hypothetical protein B0H12DRAFT_1078937 [Mycena haematopus]